MEDVVYRRMAALEDRHWWFVARRRVLADVLARRVALPPGARVLEAGCGTGGNLAMLAGRGAVSAFEPHAEARRLAQARARADLRDGRLPDRVPFAPASFDLVAALDVLEHLDDDTASLAALASRLKPGGKALITVPAFPFLWGEHDARHHHRRRYRRPQLIALVRRAGLVPLHVTYFNSLLFPLVAGVRVAKRVLGVGGEEDRMPPMPVNRVLGAVFALERHVLGRWPLPFGVSLLALAERPADGAGR